MRILIVDDDNARRTALIKHLTTSGTACMEQIDEADCADTARDLLRNQYYDALILDVVLPKRSADSRPLAVNGMALLNQLQREAFLKKPEKIIGMTAHVDDISAFGEKFANICSIVIPTRPGTDEWKAQIRSALLYTSASKLSRESAQKTILVLAIHGIRTYGEWQSRLKAIIERHTDEIHFKSYKYGYFSSLSFLLPRLRNREADRLEARINDFANDIEVDHVVIFCHSFGTYLGVVALRKLVDLPKSPSICAVLAGSVLDENFDWSFVPRGGRVRIVNDCGTDDHVLLLSKAFGIDLGMAGKVGFNGFNDPHFINRYFRGGHSHYFQGERFMEERWLPLIGSDPVVDIDERGNPGVFRVAMESIAKKIGYLKQKLFSS